MPNRDDDSRPKGCPKEGHVLWKGVKRGLISGTAPGMTTLSIGVDTFYLDPTGGLCAGTFICVGAALTISGGIVGTFVGFGKGVVDLSTRKKLNEQELGKLRNYLNKLNDSHVYVQYKLLIYIKGIISKFYFKSQSSQELVEAIQNIPDFSNLDELAEGWMVRGLRNPLAVFNNYMEATGNNGKALFVLIYKTLMIMHKFHAKFPPYLVPSMLALRHAFINDSRSHGSPERRHLLPRDVIERVGTFLEHSDGPRPSNL